MSHHQFLRFPSHTRIIEGGRRSGKTHKIAQIVVGALGMQHSVLAICPTVQMQRVLQDECKKVADEIGHGDMKWFGMDIHVLQMTKWGKLPDQKNYNLIVFVDGPDDDRNPQFHGHKFLFNVDTNLWAVLDWHANHFRFADGSPPRFVVACNEWNLVREEAQIWILELDRIKRRVAEPLALLTKLAELQTLHIDVATIIASKISVSVI